MTDKVFIDTNLWVYLYDQREKEKFRGAREIIETNFENISISTQILGELFHVLFRKKLCSQEEATKIVLETNKNFFVAGITSENIIKALEIVGRYNFSYWDSLVIATSILNNCKILYSEDMQHNQIIDNKVTIINPFKVMNNH